ncbi:MAG: MarR family transcriptional regulator [Alphaproteobacteria bacterium]|nr:MarR family transcriptional regulator [Alphaproteobacteria bacterium]
MKEKELRQLMELFFFGYRNFTSEPDNALEKYGFGRAHHRVIYFIARHPSITVSELLNILQITKQSLSRVLRKLVKEGVVSQKPGNIDKRQRHLKLTKKGIELEQEMAEIQMSIISNVCKKVEDSDVDGFRKTLFTMLSDADKKIYLSKYDEDDI